MMLGVKCSSSQHRPPENEEFGVSGVSQAAGSQITEQTEVTGGQDPDMNVQANGGVKVIGLF